MATGNSLVAVRAATGNHAAKVPSHADTTQVTRNTVHVSAACATRLQNGPWPPSYCLRLRWTIPPHRRITRNCGARALLAPECAVDNASVACASRGDIRVLNCANALSCRLLRSCLTFALVASAARERAPIMCRRAERPLIVCCPRYVTSRIVCHARNNGTCIAPCHMHVIMRTHLHEDIREKPVLNTRSVSLQASTARAGGANRASQHIWNKDRTWRRENGPLRSS